jgi:cation diffusion facilitator CzcD-associated flavoprotein CzcO
VPKQLYEIIDFPHKVASGHFPNGTEVQTYLESYASTNDLNKHIHLCTSVEKVERNGDRGWIMSLKNVSGTISKEEVDYLVVSTGMYSMPNIPKFECQDFEGDIIHSSQFTDKMMASKKNVVVIGGSKSAYDVVLESRKVSTRSTLVYREVHWSWPRNIAGLIPFQWLLSRFGQGLVSWYKGGWPGAPSSVLSTHRYFLLCVMFVLFI